MIVTGFDLSLAKFKATHGQDHPIVKFVKASVSSVYCTIDTVL